MVSAVSRRINVSKRVLSALEQVYTVSCQPLGGKTHILAASEGHGATLLFSPPDWKPSLLAAGPGGVMCLESFPGKPDTLLGIERFYPVFLAENAGITVARPESELTRPWRVRRVLDLPFVHRIRTVSGGGATFLVAATICGGKSSQEDWSQPGAVYAAAVPEDAERPWRLQPVATGLYQNHGLIVQEIEGTRYLFVGCRNGLLQLRVPQSGADDWQAETVLDQPVSDLSFFDLDGDGRLELVTIEPFHGNRLAVYRRENGAWKLVFSAAMAFGHVVWAGTLLGQPGVLAGSRKGREELAWHFSPAGDLDLTQRFEIDAGIEPTQIDVIHERGRELIVSANHKPGEVALYELRA
jgi:hypothetical protein